jgi:hypothetical protein
VKNEMLDTAYQVKVTELCAALIILREAHFIVLGIFISPSGNFNQFLNLPDTTLKYVYRPKIEFILHGDLNVNYLVDSNHKFQLSVLLQSYKLAHVTDFPTHTYSN